MEIRAKTISYSIHKNKEFREVEKNLEKEIQILESKTSLNQNDNVVLKERKTELEELRKVKMEGIVLRSKIRWAVQGEKINKYFCSLEKRHFISK